MSASRVLADLERSALSLADATLPRLIGKGDAIKRANALVKQAAADAERATQLFADAGLGTGSVDAARSAARLLTDVPLTNDGLANAGTTLGSLMRTVRQAEPTLLGADEVLELTVRERALSLVGRDALELGRDDWRALSDTLAQRDTAGLSALPRRLDGLKPIDQIAAELGAGSYSADEGAQRYLLAWRANTRSSDEVLEEAHALLQRPATKLMRSEWRTLAAVLDSTHAASLEVPRRLDGLKPFAQVTREIAAGSYRADAGAQRYFDAWRVASGSGDDLLDEARRLLQRPARELSREQWGRLGALIESPHGSTIGVPRQLDGLKPFREITRDIAAGAYAADAGAQRYLDVWSLAARSTDDVLAEARQLLHTRARDLSREQWGRLGAMVDSPHAGSLRIPRQLDGLKPFRQITHDIARGTYAADAGAQRYLDVWRLARASRDDVLDEAQQLLQRRASELSRDEWGRLGALAESSHGRQLGVPKHLDGLKPFHRITREIANGDYAADAGAQRYLHVWDINTRTREQVVGEAQLLLQRDAAELTREQWGRLGALVESSHGAGLRVPKVLDGLKPFNRITREIADGDYAADAGAQRYFDIWRRRNDPTHQVRLNEALDAVVAGEPTDAHRSIVASEWDRLQSLIAGRTPDEQAAIAVTVLESDAVAGSRNVRSSLELLRSGLESRSSIPSELEPLRAQTLELIDRNLARLSGSTPAGAVRGYSNHPDYAEVGRIRANLTLIEQARASSSVHAVTAPSAASPSSGSATSEVLSW